jgi:hypothetical protein
MSQALAGLEQLARDRTTQEGLAAGRAAHLARPAEREQRLTAGS